MIRMAVRRVNPLFITGLSLFGLHSPNNLAIHCRLFDAGWSSPVARQAHNLKAAGSNPAPATKFSNKINNMED